MRTRSNGIPDTWAEAAKAADFAFYELVDPLPELRWAGGYGWGTSPIALEVLHEVEGVEISVDTRLESSPAIGDLRQLMFDVLWHAIIGDDAPVDLPVTFTLTAADRTVLVDGTPRVFEGFAFENRAWAGLIALDEGTTLSITVRGGSVVPLAVSRCTDWAMPDRPPIDN